MRADGLAARQLPGPGAVAERLAGQRTHGANIDHVAREFGIDGITRHRGDFGMLAAVDHAQFHDASHFLAEAHATGAVDAARHLLHGDQRTHVLLWNDALFLFIAGGRCTVTYGEILQLTLPALIADRAVQRVFDEQEFHD